MKSKFCQIFSDGIPLSLNKSQYHLSHMIGSKLSFSAEFWQPFIDVEVFPNQTTNICGPLLGMLLEIAHKLQFRQTTTGDHHENFAMMKNGSVNLILCPFPPIKVVFEGWNDLRLSRYIDDIAMISILSAKTQIESIFHLLEVFDTNIWITFFVLYLLTSSLSSLIRKDTGPFVYYFGVVFGQIIYYWKRREKTSLITMIWMYGSLIMMWAYSGILLTFLVFPTPYDKIDSMDELAKRDLQFGVFDDETAYEYVTDPKEPYFEHFKTHYRKERAGNAGKEKWEQRVFTGIANGSFALVSDQPFNDYYFATKLKSYRNLYRSKDNLLVVPYFIALSKYNENQLNSNIDKVICSLFESGIYKTWVKNTLDVNNEAFIEGIVEMEQMEYQYSELSLKTFKVLLYLQFVAIISSLIAFTSELIFKSKFICNKHLPTIRINNSSAVIEKRRHRHITYKRFHLITEYWIYGTSSTRSLLPDVVV